MEYVIGFAAGAFAVALIWGISAKITAAVVRWFGLSADTSNEKLDTVMLCVFALAAGGVAVWSLL